MTKAHICRATIEAISYQVKDLLVCMMEDAGINIKMVKVDGGASVSNIMMQFQSDILNKPIFRPQNVETTALGAAFCAGLAVGVWKDKNDIINYWKIDKIFTPDMSSSKREQLYAQWKRAVERSKEWAKPINEKKPSGKSGKNK